MFSDTVFSEKVTGYDRDAMVSAFGKLVKHLFLIDIKNIVTETQIRAFVSYTDCVFDYIFEEYAISREELKVDVGEILEHAEIVPGIQDFVNADSIKFTFQFFLHNVTVLVNRLQTENTENDRQS